VGVHAGAYMRISLLRLSLQPELLVSTQGAKLEDGAGNEQNWRITYANIPVMLQYRFGLGLYGEIGPQFGFRISDNIEDQTAEDFVKKMDLSAAIGFGLRTKAGLGVGARYTAGLSKVGDFEPAGGIDPDFKNGVAQLSLYIPL
ncbi:MAG: porin family protein, partial [Chitinophagaceae bacterium]